MERNYKFKIKICNLIYYKNVDVRSSLISAYHIALGDSACAFDVLFVDQILENIQ